eukprot:gene23613-29010_t
MARRIALYRAFAFTSALFALALGGATTASSQITPQAIRIAKGAHVSVSAGQTFYATANSLPRAWTTPHALIQSAAKRLQNDPDRIYEFVYNSIETEPMFGLAKGAVGAMVN